MNLKERLVLIDAMTPEQFDFMLKYSRLQEPPNVVEVAQFMGWTLETAIDFLNSYSEVDFFHHWTSRLASQHPNWANITLPGQFKGDPLILTVVVEDGISQKSSFQILLNPSKTSEERQEYINGFLQLVDALIEGRIVSASITYSIPLPSGLKSASLFTADRQEKLTVRGFGRNKQPLDSGHYSLPTISPDVLMISAKGFRMLDPLYSQAAQAFLQWYYDPPTPAVQYGQVGHAKGYGNVWHGWEDCVTKMDFKNLRRYRT